VTEDKTPTLNCNHEAPILMTMREGRAGGGKGPLLQVDKSATLATANSQTLFSGGHFSQVRRLTPRECERLQGFPDDYTLLPGNTADGPRYKALGNSMAVPVMRWIGERISTVEALNDRQP
jgi:DNA (cytosine-5)-methyltransferase 1